MFAVDNGDTPLLADCMATHPTTNVGRGIRLSRNEFRGKRTKPNQIGFGKRLTPTMKPEIENLPMKVP